MRISDNTSGIAGERYALTCRVLEAENLHPSITYQWTKNTSSGQIQVGTDSSTLSFTPVRLSDAANYFCTVAMTSDYLTSSITAMASQSVTVQSKLHNLNGMHSIYSAQSIPLCCYNVHTHACSPSLFCRTD